MKKYIILLLMILTITIQETKATDQLDFLTLNGLTYREIIGENLFDDTNNLIKNGNFKDDISYWDTGSTTTLFDNDYGSLHIYSEFNGFDYPFFIYQNDIETLTHFYYYNLDYKSTIDSDIYCMLVQQGGNNRYTYANSGLINDDTYHNFSGTYTIHTTGDFIVFNIYTYNSTIGLKSFESWIDNVMVFDLTEIFGMGNIPTVMDFEKVIDYYKNIENNTQPLLNVDTDVRVNNPLSIMMQLRDSMLEGGILADKVLTWVTVPVFEIKGIPFSIIGVSLPTVMFGLMGFALIKKFVPLA